MKRNPLPVKCSAFTFVELLVVIVIIGILATLAIPRISCGPISGQMTNILSNARQLHLATQMMTLDTQHSGADGMDWTMMKSKGKTTPVSLATYLGALTANNYLTESDLRRLLTAPGRAPGREALTAENIAFRFFQFDSTAPLDQPFIVSGNWQGGKLTDGKPYGKKGFVIFAKGGSGGIYNRPTDADSPNIFPKDGRYHYETLK